MSIVCFAALKGGVGKTSLAVHTAHALAKRGCEVVLVDLDPQAHATNVLQREPYDYEASQDLLELAEGCLLSEGTVTGVRKMQIRERFYEEAMSHLKNVRPSFSLLTLGPAFRQKEFILAGDAPFEGLAGLLLELNTLYDYVLVDTAPSWDKLLSAATATSSVLIVPVDQSIMSIRAASEILQKTAPNQKSGSSYDPEPQIRAVVRTMVSRQAPQVAALAESELRRAVPALRYRRPTILPQ